MLQDFPLNLQVRVMSFLDHGEVYQACLISRGLNEAATRVLYMEPIWSVGCCEEEDDAVCIVFRFKYVYSRVSDLHYAAEKAGRCLQSETRPDNFCQRAHIARYALIEPYSIVMFLTPEQLDVQNTGFHR
jgi:hypothetical protein